MRILFLARHSTYFRNFESVLRDLARRGHELQLAVERSETFGASVLVQALCDEFPNVTWQVLPERGEDEWTWAARRLRLGFDYLRYLHPLFNSAHKLRGRARERTPGAFVALADRVQRGGERSRRLASSLLHRLERSVPGDPSVRTVLESFAPDVVLLSPLIELGSAQIDYVRAARELRIPTGLCVYSWDNLSSKAIVRECPDRVFVWNETQRREAMQFHDIPAERVVVTGAQCFDQWFDRTPSRSRDEFCSTVGLDAARPYLLYVCSALFRGSAPEVEFVREWMQQLRTHGSAALKQAGILIRPHPARLDEWRDVDLAPFGAALWGRSPIDAQARSDYFDSLYHSAAVIGLNTSAFIEAGIVGRSVHTVIVPKYAENQIETVHFDYLRTSGGGLLNAATDFSQHMQQLDAVLAAPPSMRAAFVRDFVRPHGLDRAATPIFVAHVEAMAGISVPPPSRDRLAPAYRWLVHRTAILRDNPRFESWTLSAREQATAERLRVADERKAEQRAASAVVRAERRERQAAKARQRHDEKAAKAAVKQQQLAEKRASGTAAKHVERETARTVAGH